MTSAGEFPLVVRTLLALTLKTSQIPSPRIIIHMLCFQQSNKCLHYKDSKRDYKRDKHSYEVRLLSILVTKTNTGHYK